MTLYDRYVDTVFRYVLFRVGDRTLAEDVTSETFLRAFRRITSISYQGRDVGAWFVTIARNLVLDHVKSSRFRLEVATADPDDGAAVTVGPENQVITQLTHTELLRCVRQFGRRPARVHRAAVPAGHVGGRDGGDHGPQRGGHQGVAAQGGTPAGAVAARRTPVTGRPFVR